MRLLIVTQKIDRNDPILGFFHRWVEEFAKHCETLIVICLEEGEHDLPQNVRVLSLGKENGQSRLKYLFNFYRYIWNERDNYDKVFVHMNPEYVVCGGVLWKILSKDVFLWYVHRQVNLKLRIAEKFVGKVFTSVPGSFKLESNKVKYFGHGIDVDIFKYEEKGDTDMVSILCVSRITRIKNIDIIFRAVSELSRGGIKINKVILVGETITKDDIDYKVELKLLAQELEIEQCVEWAGSVANSKMLEVYRSASLSINATPDGGIDKVVLESFAAGCPAFTSNHSFADILGEYSKDFIFTQHDPNDLAIKIKNFLTSTKGREILRIISDKIIFEYSVTGVVKKIIKNMYV